ncbi:MAG: hypothetical protein ACI9MS_003251 [Glaciecola sp.]|jgi:hypothetical protein
MYDYAVHHIIVPVDFKPLNCTIQSEGFIDLKLPVTGHVSEDNERTDFIVDINQSSEELRIKWLLEGTSSSLKGLKNEELKKGFIFSRIDNGVNEEWEYKITEIRFSLLELEKELKLN